VKPLCKEKLVDRRAAETPVKDGDGAAHPPPSGFSLFDKLHQLERFCKSGFSRAKIAPSCSWSTGRARGSPGLYASLNQS
jgi:hypothetical protein